ncbi:MAG TPA: FAD-dependent oxidoreductase [Euzebyales bacterium]
MTPSTAAGSVDVAVLGGGPAGLGAARQLVRRGCSATVLEAGDRVGGLAGSVDVGGVRVDFGSHRLHPSVAPEILHDLVHLPGVTLQRRERNGRIRLAGRWVAFPLRVTDALRHLPVELAAGMAWDMVTGPMRRTDDDTFDEVLRAGVGPTLAGRFYFPYARKVWGVEPSALSGEQARRRVGANSVTAIARRALRGARERPWFWYPTTGFGALSEGLAAAAEDAGAEIHLGARVTSVERTDAGWTVTTTDGGAVRARQVLSTLPVPLLARMMDPSPPPDVARAAAGLRYRAMLLIYLVLGRDRFTPYDAHYLPETWTPVTRLSEPRNYRDGPDPPGRTVLCAELPCAPDDTWWSRSDEHLARVVADTCQQAGLERPEPVAVVVHRRRRAYPVATTDSIGRLARLEAWLATQPDLLTLGRQGLFAHDNTHHALAMAWAAADAVGSGGHLDREAWNRARERFRAHVVED